MNWNSKTICRAASLAATFLLTTPLPAGAEAALHLRIDFEFQAPSLTKPTNIWRDKLPTARDALKKYLVAQMKDRFKHWSISAATSENEISMVFQVLEDRTKGIIVVMFTFHNSDGKIEGAEGDLLWLKQGKLITLAPLLPAETLPMIKAKCRDLLDEYNLLIGSVLREHVALATGGQWLENPVSRELELVVPLSWSRHKRLREARFLVACTWPHIGSADLLIKGRGRSATYSGATDRVAFDAIVTKPIKRVASGDEVSVKAEIYDEIRQLVLDGIYLAPDERQSGRFRSPK